jgi:hypothetical protein
MDVFEELGKTLEAEFEHLRRFVTGELVPQSRRAAIEALRAASVRLEELARNLEERRETPPTPTDARTR